MVLQLLAEITILIHFLFILFVILGALLVIKWKWLIWIHIPCVIWGTLLEINSWICPLTYLENYFRHQSNDTGYSEDFIGRYLIPIIYPHGLQPETQIILGYFVILVNLVIYGFILWRHNLISR